MDTVTATTSGPEQSGPISPDAVQVFRELGMPAELAGALAALRPAIAPLAVALAEAEQRDGAQ